MKKIITLICISLTGCAWQSEALKLSEDTYQVSANASPARGGITGAREMAITNAAKTAGCKLNDLFQKASAMMRAIGTTTKNSKKAPGISAIIP